MGAGAEGSNRTRPCFSWTTFPAPFLGVGGGLMNGDSPSVSGWNRGAHVVWGQAPCRDRRRHLKVGGQAVGAQCARRPHLFQYAGRTQP